jgi:integrase
VPADFERRHLTGGLWLTRPKSKAGWRVVPLVDPLKSVLERHIASSPENEWGLLFCRPTLPYDPDQVSKEWRAVLARAGIEKNVRLHDLRHTAVDLLLMAGVPEDVVMEIVGHSTRATTRAYKSRNSPRLRAAMEDLSALLASADTPQLEAH